ncbi:MAG: MBL fold metallo-hydrolase [bacterium]
MLENVECLGHATVKIKNDLVIYIDPYKISDTDKADIILITHDHYDHLSLQDIKKIQKEETVIVIPSVAIEGVSGNVKEISPGDSITVKGINITAVPAYNIKKKFHPKKKNYVGYIVTINNISYYHSGDTDRIPEMKDLNVDVAFLPVGGTYTMDAKQAAKATEDIKPKVAVPLHYGSVVGSMDDAEEFKRHCNCEVRIFY